jgi:hypothetical protein
MPRSSARMRGLPIGSLDARVAVGEPDRFERAPDGAGLETALRQVREVELERPGGGGERAEVARGAPGSERLPVALVGAARRVASLWAASMLRSAGPARSGVRRATAVGEGAPVPRVGGRRCGAVDPASVKPAPARSESPQSESCMRETLPLNVNAGRRVCVN